MPDIPLLQPVVLRGVVEKLPAPDTLVLLNRVTQTPHPYPTATWDVVKGSRSMAKPNVPNSEAHIVPRLGRSQASASFLYLREKKVFEPTTLHWIRTPGELAARNAEAAVLREVQDLNYRFDNFAEYCLWKSLTGTLTIDFPDVQATVDYQFATTHGQATAGTSWASATPQQIVADFRAWKRLVRRDGRVEPKEVFLTEATMTRIYDAFTTDADTAILMSDRMKDQYFSTGRLDGFLQLTWTLAESVYEDDAAAQQQYLADDSLIIGNFEENRPIELLVGPTADDEAPANFTGKFSKTWKDKDPSARQYLIEWSFIPIITRPEQFVYVADVAP